MSFDDSKPPRVSVFENTHFYPRIGYITSTEQSLRGPGSQVDTRVGRPGLLKHT